ncbi:hypothetical protein [Ketogulonicigenium vulgare]|uniref:hypothetical protein n=1 Tax=Ketogulonicigenium vulgare TaxID=92945 RepID=UPI00235A2A58|nr:hypothetical protein [Ketogulonicigenium vulgare]
MIAYPTKSDFWELTPSMFLNRLRAYQEAQEIRSQVELTHIWLSANLSRAEKMPEYNKFIKQFGPKQTSSNRKSNPQFDDAHAAAQILNFSSHLKRMKNNPA